MRALLLTTMLALGCGGEAVTVDDDGAECIAADKSCLTLTPCCDGLVCTPVEGGSATCLPE